MEESQPEDEEGKACSLAEALVELERFFNKEDFAHMQVLALLIRESFRHTTARPYFFSRSSRNKRNLYPLKGNEQYS